MQGQRSGACDVQRHSRIDDRDAVWLGDHRIEIDFANRWHVFDQTRHALQQFDEGTSSVGTPSVRTGFAEDIYLALLADPGDGPAQLRVIVQPMILWLWVGGGLMFAGSFLSAFPGRRRNPTDPVSAPAAIERTEPEDDGGEGDEEPELVGADA